MEVTTSVGVRTLVVSALARAGDPALATNATAVASDQPLSGFTLGAAVVAVVIGGSYWYHRR